MVDWHGNTRKIYLPKRIPATSNLYQDGGAMKRRPRETAKEITEMRWKVGATQAMTYSSALKYGFGFSVQDHHGAPLLTIVYATETESTRAEEAVRRAIEAAVDITAP